MKKIAIMAMLIAFSWGWGEDLTILSRKTPLRANKNLWSAMVVMLQQGDKVQKERQEGPWYYVATRQGKKGWLHQSAVTQKELEMSTRKFEGSGASQGEVALAAKGFSPEVEKNYRGRHGHLRYDLVDRMENDGFMMGSAHHASTRSESARNMEYEIREMENFRVQGNLANQ